MPLSSSRSSRVLRYIDLSDGNVSFSFNVDFFSPLSPIRPLPGLTIRVTLQMSYKRKELLILHEHYGKPSVLGRVPVVLGRVRVVLGRVRVAHHISLLLCEWSFCLFVFVFSLSQFCVLFYSGLSLSFFQTFTEAVQFVNLPLMGFRSLHSLSLSQHVQPPGKRWHLLINK